MAEEAEDDFVAEAEDRARRLADRDRADWSWLLADRRGRRILWGLMADAGLFRVSHTGEALATAFNEGRRAIGLALLDKTLTIDAAAFGRMQQEAAADASEK